MKIGVLGGTGFVGSYLLETLLSDGHEVVALVRPGSAARLPQNERCRAIAGEISDAQELRRTLEGCEAAIYLIGILREFPARGITFQALQLDGARRAIDTADELGVRRFLLMSANGVKPNGTAYQRTKFLAEQHLHQSTLEGTVFRSLGTVRRSARAHGICHPIVPRHCPFAVARAAVLRRSAAFRRRPRRDGAGSRAGRGANVRAIARAPETVGQTYALCGPEQLEWRRILQIIARAAGKPRKLALPRRPAAENGGGAAGARRVLPPHARAAGHAVGRQHLPGCQRTGHLRPRTHPVRRQALAYLADQGLSQV